MNLICSMASSCVNAVCRHYSPHAPYRTCSMDCECVFHPSARCVPVDVAKPLPACPDCGKPHGMGHHHSECIARLKAEVARLRDNLAVACHYASIDPDMIVPGGLTRDELRDKLEWSKAEVARLRELAEVMP